MAGLPLHQGTISCQLDNLWGNYTLYLMKTISVAHFKAQFSDLLKKVREGERIAIQYGRRKETVAILIPASEGKGEPNRPLGILREKASFKLREGFKMTEEDFLEG
jgi:antitoxin (DNA-binding transcriptional repressor) of toxin-antitoxin stability system